MLAPRITLSRPQRSALLIPSALMASLLAMAGPALAASPEELIKKAEAGCLEAAAKDGWRTDQAKVLSAKALDADKVEVIFDLTKDGTNTARLTCPYSVSQGVGKFGDNFAKSAATTVSAAEEFNASRLWWLLLPLGLGLLSWAALRGRKEVDTHGTTTAGTTYGTAASRNISVEANAHDGQLEVRVQPDITSGIQRRVRNGDTVLLTGHRRNDWLEVVNGGWVRDIDLRYDRSTVRFS
jgi:hypothetical protein